MMRKTSSNSGSSKEETDNTPHVSSNNNKDGEDEELMFGHFTHKTFVMYMTHFNIVLYALCYWIQIGVLPVSESNGATIFFF